jgi:competence protein ComEC
VAGLAACITLFIQPSTNTNLAKAEFRVTVLDIGQGTAVLIETASKRLLYDTGPVQGKDNAGQRIILPYLRGRGINHIDRMVISHSDSDHIGGAATLLKEISFDSMMGSLPSTNLLLANLEDRGVPSIPCRFGQQWSWDGVDFHIWHPHEDTLFEEQQTRKPTEMSCVLEVRNHDTSFWLTGDVEKQGEADITARLDQFVLNDLKDKKLIFMAPHHGSKTSSSQELLIALNPDEAFAQNGYRNRYGHPHPTVTARYQGMNIPFYQTPDTGAQVWTFYNKSNSHSRPIFWREDFQRLWHRPAVGVAK